MRGFLAFSVLALFAASPAAADTRDTSFVVRPGHAVRLIAVNDSRGDAGSLTWATVNLDGMVAAVDLEPGVHARTETVVRQVGAHHATLICNNYHASVAACTLSVVPAD